MKSDITPFKMCENIYFVGSSRVSVHIIKTKCGLVMIDTGYPDMYEQIVLSMESVGLKPKDISAIFHSHGHIDHFGCTQKFKEISGAKTYISSIDNSIVNGTRDLSWAREIGIEPLAPFNCDILINNGDMFKFGNTTIRCILTPGHTEGVLTFFITTKHNGKDIVCAMHGGVGMNSLTRDFLTRYNLPTSLREEFRNGLHMLKNEHVDLVLGNHPNQNKTKDKLQKILNGHESILDSSEWQQFLKDIEKKLDDLIDKENQNI